MSDIQAAAERLRKFDYCIYCLPRGDGEFNSLGTDMRTVNEAYMAELDPTRVDREFAESLGWNRVRGYDSWIIEFGERFISLNTLFGEWHCVVSTSEEKYIEIHNPTRGQVLTLLRLLG